MRIAKTLREAIQMGIEASGWDGKNLPTEDQIRVVEAFIRDFASQKFCLKTLSEDPVVANASTELWKKIFEKGAA